MKLINRLTKKLTRSASSAVKTEVKKTAIDLLPTFFGVISMIVGIVIFKDAVNDSTPEITKPMVSNTTTTTNNYFFKDMSEETIKQLLGE